MFYFIFQGYNRYKIIKHNWKCFIILDAGLDNYNNCIIWLEILMHGIQYEHKGIQSHETMREFLFFFFWKV